MREEIVFPKTLLRRGRVTPRYAPREIDIQMFLIKELQDLGFDAVGELALFTPFEEKCRVDIAVLLDDTVVEVIEVKDSPRQILRTRFRDTRQYHRYRGLGVPVTFIASESQANRFLDLCRDPQRCLDNKGLLGDTFGNEVLWGALRVRPLPQSTYRPW